MVAIGAQAYRRMPTFHPEAIMMMELAGEDPSASPKRDQAYRSSYARSGSWLRDWLQEGADLTPTKHS
jgi:hypothetical protein